MKVRDYVKNTTNPFITSAMIDADDPIRNTTFQSGLADFIRINHGALKIRKSIMKETEGEPANWIQWACSNLYIVNKYKYDHLYGTTVAQYDPIENYRMVEEEKINTEKSNSGTFVKGSQTTTTDNETTYGTHTDTFTTEETIGSRTDSHSGTDVIGKKTDVLEDENNYGAEHETDNLNKVVSQHVDTHNRTLTNVQRVDTHNKTLTYESHTDLHDNGNNNGAVNNEHYVTPYDSDTPHLESRDSLGATRDVIGGHQDTDNLTDTYGAHTDTDNLSDNYGAHTDSDNRTIDKNARKDTLNHTNEYGEQENGYSHADILGQQENENSATNIYGQKVDSLDGSVVEGQRTDTNTDSEEGAVERELTRSGNIGVTTSQQMLESERQLAMFNLYAVVAKDIIGCIANRCYGGC